MSMVEDDSDAVEDELWFAEVEEKVVGHDDPHPNELA